MGGSTHTDALSMAVIGSGYWGKNLVRNFYQLGVLKLVCDNEVKKMRS
jgi:UDP-2-acetamido-3-amino-2,3-dideoxy-glucuronate N-acetyltransferase